MNKNKKTLYILIAVLSFFIGFVIQSLSTRMFRTSIIDYDTLLKYVIFSFLFASIGDFFIVRILPEKPRLIKIFFLIHGIGGIFFFAVFWIVEFVKLFM